MLVKLIVGYDVNNMYGKVMGDEQFIGVPIIPLAENNFEPLIASKDYRKTDETAIENKIESSPT